MGIEPSTFSLGSWGSSKTVPAPPTVPLPTVFKRGIAANCPMNPSPRRPGCTISQISWLGIRGHRTSSSQAGPRAFGADGRVYPHDFLMTQVLCPDLRCGQSTAWKKRRMLLTPAPASLNLTESTGPSRIV